MRGPKLTRRSLLAGALAMPWLPSQAAFASPRFSRIVSLDYALASTLLSIGVKPAGVASLADWSRWVVEPAMPETTVDIGSAWEVNFELLVDLKPDLILSTPYLDALKPKLETLAPVLSVPVYTGDGGPVLPRAYEATRQVGAYIGMQGAAREFLALADAVFDSCRRRLAERLQPKVALVTLMDSRHARIYGAPGLYQGVLDRIGVQNVWQRPGNYWGFETIGIEQLAGLNEPEAVLFAFEPVPRDVLPKLARSPLWQALPFARPDHFTVLPGVLMFGMVREAMRFAELVTEALEQR